MSVYGNKNAKRKLSDHDVGLIRVLYSEWKSETERIRGISPTGLAEKFGVSKACIEKIVDRSRRERA